jgi:hypothetical protein
MGVEAPTPLPHRPSAGDREEVLRRLRDGCGDGRLSLDTFSARVEDAYRVRSGAELEQLVADLPAPERWWTAAVARLSAFAARLEAAWREPRVAHLALPSRTVTVGRAPDCDCVLNDPTVSRSHARLGMRDGRWYVRDLHSSNGTWVNGRRVVEDVEVEPGDMLTFAAVSYRLTAPG